MVDVPSFIWEELSALCGEESWSLKDVCISAAHISFHFLWRRVFQPASGLPWRLARGNIEDNL